MIYNSCFSSRTLVVQSPSPAQLFVTQWTAAHQASLSFTISQSLINSFPLSQWCHPTISSSVIPFSSCPQFFPASASGSFLTSQLFASGGQSFRASASASVLLTITATAKSLQSCPNLCDPIDGSHQAPHPWDSPGKNTGVGCHFLLQCMKVKSESEVVQSCPTLSNPMDCSLPGSSIHGIFQARVLEWGAIAICL